MKKALQIIVLITLTGFTGIAQTGSIKGKLTSNDTKIGLQKATVSVMKATDSSLIKADVTDGNGEFEFEKIAVGDYFLEYSYVGYKTKTTSVFAVKAGEQFIAATATLDVEPKTTDVVTVRSKKKPMIEVKADKMVFNVENSINAIGSNAFELLRKSPGVVVDKDDNLSLKGKNGVRIFLDGKPTPFDGKDLAAYLKTLNSADIEAIELITNPSARYEAEGNAGIINIKLKKSKKLGYNGSINLGLAVGITPKVNSSVTMNYRKNKWNVFGNYSNYFGDNQNDFNLYRLQEDTIYDQRAINIDQSRTHNFKVGADFTADKSNSFGVVVTAGFNSAGGNNTSVTRISDELTKEFLSTLTARNEIPGNRDNLNVNVNYRYTDTLGKEFGIDFDRGNFKNFNDSYQPNEYRYQNNLLNPEYRIYSNQTPTDINITSLKLDYATPFKKGKLELGTKISSVNTDNASDFYNVINNVKILDQNLTNKFSYKEAINAGYVNYNRPVNQKLTVQAGLRVENTVSDGNLTSFNPKPDDRVKRNYTDFFPSAAISYTASEKHSFNLTYSRRIDRPGYQDLNPFEYKLDELTFQKGNAFLRPQYSNIIEATHTFMYMLNTTLSYTNVKDFSTMIIDTIANRSFITNRNLARQEVLGLNISAPVPFAKWWNSFINLNLNRTKYDGVTPTGNKIKTSVNSGNFYMQNTFSLKKGFNVELSGFYTLPTIWGGTFQSIDFGGVDVGFSMPLFNNNATIALSYTDILRTMKFRGISRIGAYIDANGRWESQQFKVNFNWRFGNKTLKTNQPRKSGNEDEQKRAKKAGSGFGG
jgi:iron complex outermembrane recepter protein